MNWYILVSYNNKAGKLVSLCAQEQYRAVHANSYRPTGVELEISFKWGTRTNDCSEKILKLCTKNVKKIRNGEFKIEMKNPWYKVQSENREMQVKVKIKEKKLNWGTPLPEWAIQQN